MVFLSPTLSPNLFFFITIWRPITEDTLNFDLGLVIRIRVVCCDDTASASHTDELGFECVRNHVRLSDQMRNAVYFYWDKAIIKCVHGDL